MSNSIPPAVLAYLLAYLTQMYVPAPAPTRAAAAPAPEVKPAPIAAVKAVQNLPRTSLLPGSLRAGPDLPASVLGGLVDLAGDEAGKIVGGALAASVTTGGVAAGATGLASALSAASAAAPAAVPLAAAGVIASIVIPAIASGQFFSSTIPDTFNATTAEGIARSRAQAALIRQDLADTGYKFARKAGVL